jgi:protein-tyrosine phosphatase
MSYRDAASKNIVVSSIIERKVEVKEINGDLEYEENYEISCQYCGDYIDYWEDDYCEYDEYTMCIKCFCTCMDCGKYNEADYIDTLNGSEISRPICEDCHNKQSVNPIDISESIDWIKNSRDKFNKAEKNKHHQGPFYISNWLSDKLCVGGYPKNKLELNTLLGAGIGVFVCLNESFEKDRSYKYENDLPKDKNCLFINEPIKDMNITSDVKVRTLCENIVKKIYNGEKVYIHCKGGHGRTGTIAGIVLYMLYKLSIQQIFDYLQYSHDQRLGNNFGPIFWTMSFDQKEPQKNCFAIGQVPTPQSSCQRQQVQRIINNIINKK